MTLIKCLGSKLKYGYETRSTRQPKYVLGDGAKLITVEKKYS